MDSIQLLVEVIGYSTAYTLIYVFGGVVYYDSKGNDQPLFPRR